MPFLMKLLFGVLIISAVSAFALQLAALTYTGPTTPKVETKHFELDDGRQCVLVTYSHKSALSCDWQWQPEN